MLIGVRDADLAAVDRQYFFLRLGHGSQGFRHVDEVTGDSGWHVFRERRCTALDVPALLIKRWQILTKIDDKDVHAMRSAFATILFCFGHEQRAEPGLLACW